MRAANRQTQEAQRRISELGACCVAFVVRDVSVHEAPQPLDRIQMRAIGRNEMQFDPAPRSSKPFLHQSGVVIARVVKKDMDERQQRIERLDRFQEPDRRDGVDGYDLDHPGLSGREVDWGSGDLARRPSLLTYCFLLQSAPARPLLPLLQEHMFFKLDQYLILRLRLPSS